MVKKFYQSFLVLAIMVLGVSLQAKTIKGVVRERGTKLLLPGATVMSKGVPKVGVVTNSKGEFSITIPDNDKLIGVSFVGYLNKDVDVSSKTDNIIVEMDMDALELDEMVVTGQGASVSKRRISSNITSVTQGQLAKLPSNRIDQMLQTALPNIQINVTTGQPGATSIIKSRGFSSAFINSTPVIYVDGVRVDNLNTKSTLSMGQSNGAASGSIGDIPMENIDRVEYVSGGAATTLYGSDAANGVIQIFTKKGGEGKTKSYVEVQMGLDMPTSQFYHFKRTKDLLQKNGYIQRYRFGFDGGKEDFGFSFAASMSHNDGTIIHSKDKNRKYDISSGMRAKLSKSIEYQNSFAVVVNDYGRSRNGNQGGYTGLWFTEGAASANFGYNPDIDKLDDQQYAKMKAFVSKAEELQNASISIRRFQTSHSFNYRPIENLVFKLTTGVDYRSSTETSISTNEYLIWTNAKPAGTTNAGSINKYDRNYLGLTFDFNGQWTANVGKNFSFITTIGAQYFSTDDHQIRYTGTDLRDGQITIKGAGTTTADEYWSYLYNYGVFFQENIGFMNKIYLDLGIRSDYNTAFGRNVGWQNYPKIGISYALIEESFLRELRENGTITNIKLRANYGIAGSYPPPFSYQKTINTGSYLDGPAASFGSSGNPDLGAEKKHSYEAGLDISLLRSRVSFGATYYYSITKDALFQAPAPPSSGYSTYLANVGEIENKGVELFAVVTPIRTKSVDLTVNASVNTNKNKVLSTGGAAPFSIGGMSERTLQNAVQVGLPVGFIRGAKTILNEDGTYKETKLLQFLGQTMPSVYGNYSINFSYKDFNIFVSGDYQAGAYVHSFDRQFRFSKGLADPAVPSKALPEGKTQAQMVWDYSNFFVEKSDYFRFRTISASYRFKFKKYVKTADISLTLNNPYTFTKCSVDPESVLSGASVQGGASVGGFNYSTYSTPRQIIASARITL